MSGNPGRAFFGFRLDHPTFLLGSLDLVYGDAEGLWRKENQSERKTGINRNLGAQERPGVVFRRDERAVVGVIACVRIDRNPNIGMPGSGDCCLMVSGSQAIPEI